MTRGRPSRRAEAPVRRIGLHVSTAGGVEKAPARAAAFGCTAFQIFTSNPRGWAAQDLTDEACAAFRGEVERLDLRAVAHMPYLPNLASPDPSLHGRSASILEREILRCRALGIPYLVTHLGSHMGRGEMAGRDRIRRALERAIGRTQGRADDVTVLLENTAGTKNSCGTTWEEIAMLIGQCGNDPRIGVCIDTAHALAAGYPLDDPRGVGEAVKAIDRTIGLDRVRVLHVNDSKVPRGGHADRHEHLGRGLLGARGLRAVLRHPRLAGIVSILETPADAEGDEARNVAAAWRLAGAKPPEIRPGSPET